MYITDSYDVIVVGAGHAGVEAALAAARLGGKTLLATLSMDNIALMPCNPSVGGPAKGHLVREIDALGGEMGLAADKACIQMRLLNTGKGYAVQALRAQEDKPFYHTIMKQTVENQERLDVKQLMIDKLIISNGEVVGVSVRCAIYHSRFVGNFSEYFSPTSFVHCVTNCGGSQAGHSSYGGTSQCIRGDLFGGEIISQDEVLPKVMSHRAHSVCCSLKSDIGTYTAEKGLCYTCTTDS